MRVLVVILALVAVSNQPPADAPEVVFLGMEEASAVLVGGNYVEFLQSKEISMKTQGQVRPPLLSRFFGEDLGRAQILRCGGLQEGSTGVF